ncbi:glycosyltransferase family 4 protein [Vogesella sp. DC21W]|uniref:Glycosyltransferase family 4 protein n=1 Tax=Vogesella aquatica TaxID=2984206 RepID=A0ABT5IZA4_9NEIS|nr:glycosyltransferase family 4 protein [Vogesella aquatica]MDC7717897.1 glycosyltransferase family 4 protein [Vogesella aquatica]
MNILLINHYAGSIRHGMEFRPYYMAREWQKLGHKVMIVAATESHVRTVRPVSDKSVSIEDIDGITYAWLRTTKYNGNGVGRVINMFSFLGQLFRHASALLGSFKPDVVIASSTYPLDIWPARHIARKYGAKLVFEVHDLWPLSPIELGGMSPKHPFIRLLQCAEDYAYKHADHVVSMLPNVKDYMVSRGMVRGKLHIVPNGICPEDWLDAPVSADHETVVRLQSLKAAGKRIVGYAGTHGVANALDTVLDAAALTTDDSIAYVLVGSGPDKDALMARAKQMSLHNIHFLSPVPKGLIPCVLQYFDVAYIGLQSQPLFRFGIAPNKLMDYMMAGRPVIMAINAGNDPVAEAACGMTISPENPALLYQAVSDLLAVPGDERVAMGKRGRNYVLQHHAYEQLASSFLSILK